MKRTGDCDRWVNMLHVNRSLEGVLLLLLLLLLFLLVQCFYVCLQGREGKKNYKILSSNNAIDF